MLSEFRHDFLTTANLDLYEYQPSLNLKEYTEYYKQNFMTMIRKYI